MQRTLIVGCCLVATVPVACSSAQTESATNPAPCSAPAVNPDSIPLPTPDRSLGGSAEPERRSPRLRNSREAQRALQAAYPVELRDAGIGGVVGVWTLINASGEVIAAQLQTSSGYSDFDRAALRVARKFEFAPALQDSCAVPVWVAFPITFTTHDRLRGWFN